MDMAESTAELETGALVSVRGHRWVVSGIETAPIKPNDATDESGDAGLAEEGQQRRNTLVSLQSVEDGRFGDTLDVIWEVEPGRKVLPSGSLPEITDQGFDPPDQLAAFLDAVRWSAVTSADTRTLQAPYRSGVAIEDYQLEPLARAVSAPRVNLLLADDVGLGKTIEAGLVAQELLLRHRTQRVVIVCPAGLTTKWRDEMDEKFGLDFTIVDSERCAQVRRDYGSAANPFNVYPLMIVSLPWLRGAKAQRLLDEVLPADGPSYPRTFDLLILDEAHHVAPAAPKQVYAVDSQQTKLIRKLAPHFTHRLFASATPHNGYAASFTALLEILDDQRFLRGVEPAKDALADTVVRRLKKDITDADGNPRFAQRHATAIPVDYPESEREIHALLTRFAALRRQKLTTNKGRKATDLVTLLLKKRLFSSPAALAHTVEVYQDTLRAKSGMAPVDDEIPEWMDDFFDDLATYDDERLAEAEDDVLDRTRGMQPDADDDEHTLLKRMHDWAIEHEAQPDAKARELMKYLAAVCRPDGEHWTNERVVVFTEYRDTQLWLKNLLLQEGIGGDRVAELHGGVNTDDREQLRLAFQKPPEEHPVRILLATDAASEGIDLQKHCHRLVNYDIPFNPNKLEQRIGRVDRYGQTRNPEIRHFVGIGWEKAGQGSYEADLEFLSRVATKVSRMEQDLGSVNAVLSAEVQRRMLGAAPQVDVDAAGRDRQQLAAETNVRDQVRRLRDHLDQTVQELGITPTRVKRVVDTALALARQQPLREHRDDKHAAEGLFDVPTLTGSWVRASAGLFEKFQGTTAATKSNAVPKQLPVTFDQEIARGRDDVVLAHLNHPLVAMSTRLLRTAVSNDEVGLRRVTAVVSDDPELDDVLVGAYSRFVLVGADGVRLHEEVLYAGGWAPENGRFRRLENLTTLGGILNRALTSGRPLSDPVWRRVAARWPRISDALISAIDWRKRTRQESLENRLAHREQEERNRINHVIGQFETTLRAKVAEDDDEDALFSKAEARDERAQYQRDRQRWQQRLDSLADERARELDAITARYSQQTSHRFPVAVVFVVPKREATR
jgi:superfamily II DNA or RNA helicase